MNTNLIKQSITVLEENLADYKQMKTDAMVLGKLSEVAVLDNAIVCDETALEALQEKLERQENKALTLSELAKEYIKKPVWVSCEEEWKVIDSISFSVVGGIENYIEFTDGSELEYTESEFYKHKPNGGDVK